MKVNEMSNECNETPVRSSHIGRSVSVFEKEQEEARKPFFFHPLFLYIERQTHAYTQIHIYIDILSFNSTIKVKCQGSTSSVHASHIYSACGFKRKLTSVSHGLIRPSRCSTTLTPVVVTEWCSAFAWKDLFISPPWHSGAWRLTTRQWRAASVASTLAGSLKLSSPGSTGSTTSDLSTDCERRQVRPVTFQVWPPLYKCFLWAFHQMDVCDKCREFWETFHR